MVAQGQGKGMRRLLHTGIAAGGMFLASVALGAGAAVQKPAPAPREAPSTAAFGFELGQVVSIPECASKVVFGIKTLDVSAWAQQHITCYEPLRTGTVDEGYTGTLSVRFGNGEAPQFLYSEYGGDRYFFLGVINGRIESVSASTGGVRVQESVLAKLLDKYGAPTAKTIQKATTMAGAQFESVTAVWQFSNLRVDFLGTADRIDTGYVSVLTPVGAAEAAKKAAAASNQGRQL